MREEVGNLNLLQDNDFGGHLPSEHACFCFVLPHTHILKHLGQFEHLMYFLLLVDGVTPSTRPPPRNIPNRYISVVQLTLAWTIGR